MSTSPERVSNSSPYVITVGERSVTISVAAPFSEGQTLTRTMARELNTRFEQLCTNMVRCRLRRKPSLSVEDCQAAADAFTFAEPPGPSIEAQVDARVAALLASNPSMVVDVDAVRAEIEAESARVIAALLSDL